MNEPDWRKAAEAHKRAMPMQRLLGNGMDHADATALYASVDDGTDWADAASALGAADARRGRAALAAGPALSALGWYAAPPPATASARSRCPTTIHASGRGTAR
ncbi:hypothetical protein [Streptomyces sp. URMC 129]|uniref:hypothetical protein n=1 Tax=Streptomyces sp. URMC 129 TaxID=3423407 RepID=UPI003F1D7D05